MARAEGGSFIDAKGEKHRWRVQNNHVLLWDDQPFVPMGGLFQAKSWGANATDADLAEDIDALKKISAAGVLDVYFQPPAPGGITRANPVYLQKLIDAAEGEGMTYGISLADGPRSALLAYHILPTRYRQQVPAEGGLTRFGISNMTSAYFAASLIDPRGGSSGDLSAEGEADSVQEGARVNLAPAPSPQAVIVYPERLFTADVNPLPNVWEGADEYRDRLLTLFRKVKLGKGFRFFTDLLPPEMDLTGEAAQLFPTSKDFATEWSAWLQRRYKAPEELARAWKLKDVEISYADAARLVPLFYKEKGFHALYDHRTGKRVPADLAPTFWNDLDDFKVDSYRAAINDLSLALKRGVADVPIVWRSRGYQKLLAYAVDARRPELRRFEFDGVGIDAYGKGQDAARYGGADVFTQVADCPRSLWMPVLSAQEARIPESTSPGFSSQQGLSLLLDGLRGVGAKGFYLDGARVVDPARKPYDLSAIPTQLGWLPEYAKLLSSINIATVPAPTKNAMFYPRQLATLMPTPLTGGAWLLPTDSRSAEQFKVYNFGKAGRCYSMDDGDGVVFYLYNPSGPRQITLRVPKTPVKRPEPFWTPAERGLRKKDTIALTIGPEPLRLDRFGPGLPIPEEAFAELNDEARLLLEMGKSRKLADMTVLDANYQRLKANYRPENPDLALGTLQGLQQLTEKLRDQLQPYAWIEAEGVFADDGLAIYPAQYTFDQVATRPGASGGRVLLVGDRKGTGQSATASYEVRTGLDGVFRLWVAASPTASFSLRLDGLPWGDQNRTPRAVGKTYGAPALIWMDAGQMLLTKGTHKLEIRAEGPMSLDAFLLTPGDFVPNGAIRPPVLPADAK